MAASAGTKRRSEMKARSIPDTWVTGHSEDISNDVGAVKTDHVRSGRRSWLSKWKEPTAAAVSVFLVSSFRLSIPRRALPSFTASHR